MSSKPLLFRLAQLVRFIAPFVAALLSAPGLAHAQGFDEFGTYGPSANAADRSSPMNFGLELRFGPYLPRVDSEFTDGEAPFKRYFGTTHRLAVGTEFDWFPLKLDRILRFGPGVGLMYTAIGADAFFNKFPEQRAPGQRTSIRILPHWVTAVLHVDALAQRTPIPVVLTAKVGLAQALWWVKDLPQTMRAEDGTLGKGRSYGTYYGLGAQLDLGFLESTRKKRLDSFIGINSIYFYGEFYILNLDGFGASGVMNLSDRSWVLGLAFDL